MKIPHWNLISLKQQTTPLPYETKVLLIDYHNGKTSELPSGWISGVGYTAADEMKAHFYKTRADKNKYMASASDTNDSDDFAYALRFSFCIDQEKYTAIMESMIKLFA